MSQVVRKFILLSIIITLILFGVLALFNNSRELIETFGIRDSNGKRRNLLRKCMGNTTDDVIYQNEECVPEPFINRISSNIKKKKKNENSLDNRTINALNITNSSNNKIANHILQQLPELIKNNDNIESLFDNIESQTKKSTLDVFSIKFLNPINLKTIEKGLKMILMNNMDKLSTYYNQFTKLEKNEFNKLFIDPSLVAVKINVNDNHFLLNPKVNMTKDDFTTPFTNNSELLLYVNTNKKATTKKIYNFNIERLNPNFDMVFKDISIEFGLFNMSNNNDFTSFYTMNF